MIQNLTIYNYDATGRPIGMSYRENSYGQYQWDVYWFDLNLQGDIVAVYNKTGVKLVSYSYDPWGKCTVTYSNGGASTSAVKNNLRYRGYYLDSDLGLYYLQSRYYDPNTYRFISPDSVMSGVNGSLHGFNLYVYCFNNPINMTDAQGNWPKWIEDAIDIAMYAISIAVAVAVAVNVSAVATPSVGIVAGIATFSTFNNLTNAIYYSCISDGESDVSNDSYQDTYVNRWDRLDYTKEQTDQELYTPTAWIYYSEYNLHMYGWYATKNALGKDIFLISDIAQKTAKADVVAGELDSRWYVNFFSIIIGVLGV